MASNERRMATVDEQFERGGEYPLPWRTPHSECTADSRRFWRIEMTRSHNNNLVLGGTRTGRTMPNYPNYWVDGWRDFNNQCPKTQCKDRYGRKASWQTRFDNGEIDGQPDKLIIVLQAAAHLADAGPCSYMHEGLVLYEKDGHIRWFKVFSTPGPIGGVLVDDGLELMHAVLSRVDMDQEENYEQMVVPVEDKDIKKHNRSVRMALWALEHLRQSYGQGKIPMVSPAQAAQLLGK